MEKTTTSLEQEIKNYKNKAKELKDKAREKYLENVNDVRDMARMIGGEASVRAKELVDHVEEYVEENPKKAVLWGVGLGVGVGIILTALLRRD